MKTMKKITIGSMVAMMSVSAITACVIATDPACPSEVNTNVGVPPYHGMCQNVTDDYPSARTACVGETGQVNATQLPQQCLYICDDGTQQTYFTGVSVSGASCSGTGTSGQCR